MVNSIESIMLTGKKLRLAATNRLKSEFLSVMSHELRTNLVSNAIKFTPEGGRVILETR